MLTVRQLKAFVENIPDEWDDEIVAYGDFAHSDTLCANLCRTFQGVTITDGDEPLHTYLVNGELMDTLRPDDVGLDDEGGC